MSEDIRETLIILAYALLGIGCIISFGIGVGIFGT